MWMLSCLCLSIVIVCCVSCVLFPIYHDNFLQRLGMAVLAFGCAARIQHIWATQHVSNDWFLVHGGMALISVGAFVKMYWLNREKREVTNSLSTLELALRSAHEDVFLAPQHTNAVLTAIDRRCADLRNALTRHYKHFF